MNKPNFEKVTKRSEQGELYRNQGEKGVPTIYTGMGRNPNVYADVDELRIWRKRKAKLAAAVKRIMA